MPPDPSRAAHDGVQGSGVRLDVDVVIIGAGPGGAATALALLGANPALHVLLVDKRTFPRDKCCGDGLGPGVVDVVRHLGVTDILDGERPLTGCTVIGPGGIELTSELPRINGRVVVGHVVPRVDFDARLQQAAVDRGARFMVGRFTATWMRDDRRVVAIATETGTIQVHTKLLVGADGANSRVRRALGVRATSDRRTGIAVRAYVDVIAAPADAGQRLLFEFSDDLLPAYAWYFPATHDVANIGLGVSVHDHKKRHLDLDEMLERFLTTLRGRGFELGPPRLVRTYRLPLATKLASLAHERAVLIGDAAAMINPLSGEGIFYAMAAGTMLSDAVIDALDSDLGHALATFERTFRHRFVAHYRSNAVAQFLLRSRRWARLAIRSATNDERVLAAAVQLLFGEGVITPATTWRLLRAGSRNAPRITVR